MSGYWMKPRWLKRAFAWNAGGGRLGRFFFLSSRLFAAIWSRELFTRKFRGNRTAFTLASLQTIFRFMGCPWVDMLKVAEHWGMAGCSQEQSSLAAVPAGFCHLYAYVTNWLGLTPCARVAPPLPTFSAEDIHFEEGARLHRYVTGQPPCTNACCTGQSPGVFSLRKVQLQGWEATSRHGCRTRPQSIWQEWPSAGMADMGAVPVEEASCEGLHGSMGQQRGPFVDEG